MSDRAIATLMVVVLGIPVVFVAYAILGRWVLHGPVTPESLGRSVALEFDYTEGECQPSHRSGVWRCDINDGYSDQRIVYVRPREGSSCWEGTTRAGCVHRWQW